MMFIIIVVVMIMMIIFLCLYILCTHWRYVAKWATHTQTRPGSAWMRDSFRTRLLKLSNECVDQNDDDVIIVCVI